MTDHGLRFLPVYGVIQNLFRVIDTGWTVKLTNMPAAAPYVSVCLPIRPEVPVTLNAREGHLHIGQRHPIDTACPSLCGQYRGSASEGIGVAEILGRLHRVPYRGVAHLDQLVGKGAR